MKGFEYGMPDPLRARCRGSHTTTQAPLWCTSLYTLASCNMKAGGKNMGDRYILPALFILTSTYSPGGVCKGGLVIDDKLEVM